MMPVQAVKFGDIYAITNHNFQLPNEESEAYWQFPVGQTEGNVQDAVNKMKTLAENNNLPFADLVVSRPDGYGVMGYRGGGEEVRLIFTDQDAVEISGQLEEAKQVMIEAEQFHVDNERLKRTLINLSNIEKYPPRNGKSRLAIFLAEKFNIGSYEKLTPEQKNKRVTTLEQQAQLEAEQPTLQARYDAVVKPVLETAKNRLKGYLEIDKVFDRLSQQTMNVKTGGDFPTKLPTSGFRNRWWHSPGFTVN